MLCRLNSIRIPVFWHQTSWWYSSWVTCNRTPNISMVGTICNFRQISQYNSKTVQDRETVCTKVNTNSYAFYCTVTLPMTSPDHNHPKSLHFMYCVFLNVSRMADSSLQTFYTSKPYQVLAWDDNLPSNGCGQGHMTNSHIQNGWKQILEIWYADWSWWVLIACAWHITPK